MLGGVEYYADAEGGAYLEDPTHTDLVGLIQDLDQTSNTFVVLYPGDETREWFISVTPHRGALDGYEIERHDPDTDPDQARPTKTPTAVPTDIATDILAWISQR
jgi:hypothetical protein